MMSSQSKSVPMMGCGHAADAFVGAERQPCCVICYGINPKATVVVTAPDLTGRVAECTYCNTEKPSSTNLAFFEYRPGLEKDKFYCGCHGWD